MKFRSIPSTCEAELFVEGQPLPFRDRGVVALDGTQWYVNTLGGPAAVHDGDWIILEKPDSTDPRERLLAYPCKPEVFVKRWVKA